MANKVTAIELAKKQRDISVAEFFSKNRHLLGFDNPRKALLTSVKEAIDNSLDACEDIGVLPEIKLRIKQLGESRYIIIVEDNGPGIVKKNIPSVFAKLLYGSKFHKLAQSRGQQGIGISAAVLYSQLTTGKPVKIRSKIGKNKPAHYYELHIDTQKNEPHITRDEEISWDKDHGTRIELELEGVYYKGARSVSEYLKYTAIANPHVNIDYVDPYGKRIKYLRVVNKAPKQPKEIKPHPRGIELGMFINMLKDTNEKTIQAFLSKDFSRVTDVTAKKVCDLSEVNCKTKPNELLHEQASKLYRAIQGVKLMSPPTNCIVPIGSDVLEKGLRKEFNADFYFSGLRPPSVYRGNPFQIEAAIAYGGDLDKEGSMGVIRFANRVPLQSQPGACSITKSIVQINWRNYGLSQSGGALPIGPVVLVVHIASVWVPFTSESKEAIAHYPEIIKEIKSAVQECGRHLGIYIRKTVRAREQAEKINLFDKYIPELATSLNKLTGENKEKIIEDLIVIRNKILPQILKSEGVKKKDFEEVVNSKKPFKKFEK